MPDNARAQKTPTRTPGKKAGQATVTRPDRDNPPDDPHLYYYPPGY